MKYTEYLKTEYWKNRRKEFIKKTHRRCFICRTKKDILDVHHKRYRRNGTSILFREKHSDFRLLCRSCHGKIHKLKLESILSGNLIKRRTLRDLLWMN